VTLEANPESVSEPRLAAYRRAGVNRVSFGVQSFREDELRRLSRLHSADRARAAFAEARAAGFDNISLDLMMWLPGQRVSEWLESVDASIALDPEHLSLYMLEVYPNAPLKDEMARARCSQAPDDDVAAMYVAAMERLDEAGFEQYEVSNVAEAGRRSRHNLKYWTDAEWLGFGCGAHSTRHSVRWKKCVLAEELHRPGSPAIADLPWTSANVAGRTARRREYSPAYGSRTGRHRTTLRQVFGVDIWVRPPCRPRSMRRGPGCLRREGTADAVDPPGNASCSRGDGDFR
jgi:hypothetical protein